MSVMYVAQEIGKIIKEILTFWNWCQGLKLPFILTNFHDNHIFGVF
jgi:hypothetical protein